MLKGKRVLSVVLVLLVLLGAVKMPMTATAAAGDGMTFSQKRMYVTSENIGDAPKSYEAVIKIPSTFTGRAGVIVGNYYGSTNSFCLEIVSQKPRLHITQGTGIYDVYFDQVPALNTGEWLHLAIVHEGPNSVKCYVNGELKQTATATKYVWAPNDASHKYNGLDVPYVTETGPMVLGGDHRYASGASNAQYFQGSIKSVALYSDVRTASEVQSDMNGQYGDKLVLRYDMSNLSSTVAKVEDLSGNGFDACFENWEERDAKSPSSYDYAFAVVGDTQCINDSEQKRHYLETLYGWIADNVESQKIKYVFGLGDITENQTDAEYTHAVENIKKLNGLVPYSLVRGNHDNGNEKFTTYFGYEEYTSQIGGHYNNSSLNNVWMEYSVGDIKYLVLALDYNPSTEVLAWACDVVEEHPEHNVIITTHGYLYRDGSRLNKTGNKLAVPDPNNGDVVWENLGKKYENISMILCGHDPTNEVVISTATGDNGNTVTQMLIDPQSMDKNFLDLGMQAAGMVAMFYVSNSGSTIQIDYYSTIRDAYWGETKTITVDVVGCEHPNTTTHNRVEPTCSAPGHEAYTSCDDCGVVVSGVNAVIPTTPHNMTHYDKIPSTPTEAGRIEYWECSVCNNKYSDVAGTQVTTDVVIPPFGKELALSEASLSLGDSISLNFYASKNGLDESEYVKPFVRIIVDGKETTVAGVEKDGQYIFAFDQLAAHQMNETIYVVLCAEARGVICSSEMIEYSVAEYCYTLLADSADNAELRTLLVDILNYGAAAQTYVGDTDTLVNANLTAEQKTWASANQSVTNITNKAQETVENPTVTWKSAGLNLTGRVTLRLKVEVSDVKGLSVKVAGFDNCVATFEKISDGNYYIYIQGIMLTQLNDTLDITVYNGETAVSNTLRYSIASYVYANQSGDLGSFLQAMMKLGSSAIAYKAKQM